MSSVRGSFSKETGRRAPRATRAGAYASGPLLGAPIQADPPEPTLPRDPELREFLAADEAPVVVDPRWKAALRDRLWDLLEERREGPGARRRSASDEKA